MGLRFKQRRERGATTGTATNKRRGRLAVSAVFLFDRRPGFGWCPAHPHDDTGDKREGGPSIAARRMFDRRMEFYFNSFLISTCLVSREVLSCHIRDGNHFGNTVR